MTCCKVTLLIYIPRVQQTTDSRFDKIALVSFLRTQNIDLRSQIHLLAFQLFNSRFKRSCKGLTIRARDPVDQGIDFVFDIADQALEQPQCVLSFIALRCPQVSEHGLGHGNIILGGLKASQDRFCPTLNLCARNVLTMRRACSCSFPMTLSSSSLNRAGFAGGSNS